MSETTSSPELQIATPETLLSRLRDLKINFEEYTHPAVFTVEEAKELRGELPGEHCKSLFLKAKGGALFLVVCLEWRRMDMKQLADLLPSRRLSFGQPDLLLEKLGVTPGSVTPFGVINDLGPEDDRVTVVLDKKMMEAEMVNYHPLVNTATIGLSPSDLNRFLVDCDHVPLILDLDPATQK
ncbi:MAG: DNA-binding protein [Rhodospirillaceae bacterium]|nr:DNA-binding protein [Rhodospirillaceae bacterium]|tara:strand:- start:65106 stop:65651 length:546 start_codon:yes stop_codon:yes gene_type:complete